MRCFPILGGYYEPEYTNEAGCNCNLHSTFFFHAMCLSITYVSASKSMCKGEVRILPELSDDDQQLQVVVSASEQSRNFPSVFGVADSNFDGVCRPVAGSLLKLLSRLPVPLSVPCKNSELAADNNFS